VIDTLLLLALPASGKSELRRYLASLDPEVAARDFGLGPQIQIDDYPYVHLMRRISEEQVVAGLAPDFFASPLAGFTEPKDWLTLIHLVNEDVARLWGGGTVAADPAEMLDRILTARKMAGIESNGIAGETEILPRIAGDIAQLVADLPGPGPDHVTTVIEFARGGPEGAVAPLPHPLGYRPSLEALDAEILDRASVLYVQTTSDESRRRNVERARPGPDGAASILHHGVPGAVMRDAYGMDDMEWLQEQAREPGTIPVLDHDLPMAVFDNRRDHTSFLRNPQSDWPHELVERLHADLVAAFASLTGPGNGE
jgi:hypothetical protein